MKFNLIALVFLLIINKANSQSVDELLSNAEKINKNEILFLQFDGEQLKYHVGTGEKSKPQKFARMEPSQVFLISDKSINIFLRPVNPLSLFVNSEAVFRADSNSLKLSKALTDILTQLSTGFIAPKVDCDSSKVKSISDQFDAVAILLKENNQTKINQVFGDLKKLTFEDQESTRRGIEKAETEIKGVSTHFKDVNDRLSVLKRDVAEFKCSDIKFLFNFTKVANNAISNIEGEISIQMNRMANLNSALSSVKEMYDKGARTHNNMINWYVPLEEVVLQKGKIADFTLKLNKGGFEISDKNEIVEAKKEVLKTYTLSLKRFNHFIPEISSGIVYSNIFFPKYGTGLDAQGRTVVADAGRDNISKFSVASMVNFNYYVVNSSIHPFLQLGVGTNLDYQSLFVGTGIRLTDGIQKISLSIGGASPWVKKLSSLEVGKEVQGTAELEKDLSKEVQWFKNIYFGIQVKL